MNNSENAKLCPTCRTGQETYMLDGKTPFCPFLHMHNGCDCSAYVKIESKRKEA